MIWGSVLLWTEVCSRVVLGDAIWCRLVVVDDDDDDGWSGCCWEMRMTSAKTLSSTCVYQLLLSPIHLIQAKTLPTLRLVIGLKHTHTHTHAHTRKQTYTPSTPDQMYHVFSLVGILSWKPKYIDIENNKRVQSSEEMSSIMPAI